MKKIDFKSFLIGVLSILILVILLGSTLPNSQDNMIGKYQVAAAATNKSPKYIIIDTENGEIIKTGYIAGN